MSGMGSGDEVFASAWQKFVWGFTHAHYLRNDLGVFGRAQAGKTNIWLRADFVADTSAFEVRVDRMTQLPVYWANVIGDIAFNYRAALDHLAWALVTRGSTPPATLTENQQRDIQFPLVKTKDKLAVAMSRRLPGVDAADRAIIEKYQPFDGNGDDEPGHWLRVTVDINNADKHRLTRPILPMPTGGRIEIFDVEDCEPTGNLVRPPAVPSVEVGALLATVPVRNTGMNPRLRAKPEFEVALHVWDDVELGRWLTVTEPWISTLLNEFSPMPDITGWIPDLIHPGPV